MTKDKKTYNIADLFYESCKLYPNRLAIIEEKKNVTFGQLENQIQETIAYFRKKGIRKGDRILVFVGMCKELYRIILAIFSMGAIAVFVDEWAKVSRLSICCKMAKCKAIIAPQKYRIVSWIIPELRNIPIFLQLHGQIKPAKQWNTEPTTDMDSALITFTSGSTGIPKAVDRSHGFLKAQFDALYPLIKGNISMTMLPMVLLLNLGLGITSVIADFKSSDPKSFNAKKILNQINRHQIDSIVASPFYLLELAKEVRNITTIEHIVSGGAPIFASEAAQILNAFPKSKFTIVYGSTEAEPISHCQAYEAIENKNAPGILTGFPVPSVSVKIIPTEHISISTEQELNNLELPFKCIGEIIVSGDSVNKSYIDNPQATAENKIMTEYTTWHRTGDSGYIDEKGQLFLTGRTAQIIHAHGKTYYPFSIENKLKNIEGIKVGTLLLVNNKLILVLNIKDSFDQSQVSDIDYDDIQYLNEFPYDPRHHSKIDYLKLLNLIQDPTEQSIKNRL